MSRTFTPLERSKGVRTALCKTRKNYLSGKCRKSGIGTAGNRPQYRGAFQTDGEEHEVCQWFWQMVRAWSPERRAQLLQWTTGHARVPVQGFSHLMGRDGVLRKFTLTSLELSQAVYPRAHTCFNRIDVPLYRTKEELVSGFEFVLELGDQTFTMD